MATTIKNQKYAVTVWYMEYQQGGSDKFYQVFVSESGVCVLRWGRRGAVGQHSVTAFASYDEARDVGLRQVYAKKSKGYVQKYGDMKFMASKDALDYAQNGNPQPLAAEFAKSLESGQFDGAKEAVLKHYTDFAEQAKALMDRAASADLDTVMNEYDQLEQVWAEINDKHAEVEIAMSVAKQTMMQKLMSGNL